ncbi:hypothetical protein [Ktedonospora formicarum]|uniref:Uncharacterized protein n=1 Tax=Ktedonospora formicarum TaxID=2778364 RepID=A0A8J3IFR1_9CHLR|nr:hypothetical protein [Ktedonospora formicarum]GHO50364.1 hypothetical protein KSX_85270 [Ktedonospora formicarum]
MMLPHILTKRARFSLLLLLSFFLAVNFALSYSTTARASGGGRDENIWYLNANGYVDYLYLTLPWYGGENDVLFSSGSVFGQWVQSQAERQSDGTTRIDFIILSTRDSGYADYFNVYHGVQSADGQSMHGTFNVYTGSKTYYFPLRKYIYSYAMAPETHPWAATFVGMQNSSFETGHSWSLTSEGPNGTLDAAPVDALSFGWAVNQPIIGFIPLPSSCDYCPMYFIRATSRDWTTMEIYQGYGGTTTMYGSFVEFSGDHSLGYQNDWEATYLR